jgi:peptidoglycan/xylan/chitin deacetylase (PgdA/CDA1 family)
VSRRASSPAKEGLSFTPSAPKLARMPKIVRNLTAAPQAWRELVLSAMLLAGLACAGAVPQAASQTAAEAALTRAVVFAYGRFGEDLEGTSNTIELDRFAEHIEELKGGEYHVLPLPEIVAALKSGRLLPDRTIAITIDGADRSVYSQAWPRLKAAGLPFTLFVATDSVDRRSGSAMSWLELRELASAGVTIGNLTASHPHLVGEDRAYMLGQIARASERIEAELGTRPTLFAYPYGEYDQALRELLRAQGFDAGFGLHSGVVHARGDRYALPRFTLSGPYGTVERFRLAAQALPLLVTDVTQDDPVATDNPPDFAFTVDPLMGDIAGLACFASDFGALSLERLDERRIALRFPDVLPAGRERINCTMPAPGGRWRWFGTQLVVPAALGAN